jgi:hypothetical protein
MNADSLKSRSTFRFSILVISLVTLSLALEPMARADAIELKTGERIEGAFKQANAVGAVIEVAGQSITIPLEKLKAIYFGAPPSVASTAPVPFQEALDALKALRSVTNSGIAYRDYTQRVLDARVKVDRYLSSQGKAAVARRPVRAAMLQYELVSYALNPEKVDFLSTMGKIAADPDITTCPVLKDLTDESLSKQQHFLKSILRQTAEIKQKLAGSQHALDQSEDLGLTFLTKAAPANIWPSASEQIVEAERSEPRR